MTGTVKLSSRKKCDHYWTYHSKKIGQFVWNGWILSPIDHYNRQEYAVPYLHCNQNPELHYITAHSHVIVELVNPRHMRHRDK